MDNTDDIFLPEDFNVIFLENVEDIQKTLEILTTSEIMRYG